MRHQARDFPEGKKSKTSLTIEPFVKKNYSLQIKRLKLRCYQPQFNYPNKNYCFTQESNLQRDYVKTNKSYLHNNECSYSKNKYLLMLTMAGSTLKYPGEDIFILAEKKLSIASLIHF